MRQAIERQRRLDCDSVSQVVLNLNCRDELIPVLRGCQTNLEMSHLVQDRNVTLVAFPRDRWASYV